MKELIDGNEFWTEDGLLHREDGPAVVKADGGMEYWLNGQRENSPAAVRAKWFVNEADKNQPTNLDDFYYHEALDRVHVINSTWADHVLDHPAIQANEDLKKSADDILTAMVKLYNLIGEKY